MKEQAAPTIDYRPALQIHYVEFSKYLVAYLAAGPPPNSRSNARSKLARLTIDEFYMMSTDVYDEVMRRKLNANEVPFLPAQEEFHPQRNQARQKLAILPPSRLDDLAGDVLFELGRRYPEFRVKADVITKVDVISTSTSTSIPAGALVALCTHASCSSPCSHLAASAPGYDGFVFDAPDDSLSTTTIRTPKS